MPEDEIIKLLKQNNKILRSLHRHMRAGQLLDLAKIIVALVLIWFAYRAVLPYIPKAQQTVEELQTLQQQVIDQQQKVQDFQQNLTGF